jgi:hypothetical protein
MIVVALTALAATTAAQTPAPARRNAAASPFPVVTTGTVVGSAWKGDTTPYPHARIRLRNAQTGRGVTRTEADVDGRFRFAEVDPGAYVVELLSDQDKVLAVGDLFGVAAGGEATTLVRLSAKTPWFGGFFGNAAAAAITAASTLGVTAVGSNGRPVSPQ